MRHEPSIARWSFPAAIVALVLAGCQSEDRLRPDAGARSSTTLAPTTEGTVKTKRPAIAISRPGAVAVDVHARRAELKSANALAMCPGGYTPPVPAIKHIARGPSGYGLDESYSPLAAQLRTLGASCLGGNATACESAKRHAMDWAQNSRLAGPKGGKHDGVYWNTTMTVNMRLLSPLLSTLGVAEQVTPLDATERAVLEAWLKEKMKQHEHGMRTDGNYKGGKDGTTARKAAHNHAVQSSIVAMSYGAWANDERLFKVGIGQWFITLKSMRRDGSLPIETRRGARALFYHGRTLSGLTQLAERARVQGIDLYAHAPSASKTIHHAVAFFIDAIEQPDLVLRYARTNKSPGPSRNYKVQDLGSNASTMGWIAPYIRRFPEHPNTRRLRARLQSGDAAPKSYLTPSLDTAVRANGYSSEWIGVDARCFYAVPKAR